MCFLTGANQLLWYYAELERQRCYNQTENTVHHLPDNVSSWEELTGQDSIEIDINHCLAWRRFAK